MVASLGPPLHWETKGVSGEAPLRRGVGPVPAEPPRLLILDGNLLTAEAVALALIQMTFAVRFVIPVTPEHVRDVVPWQPAVALIDIDSVDMATSLECVAILCGAGVPVGVMSGERDTRSHAECVNAGVCFVVDKKAPLTELTDAVKRLIAGEVLLGDDTRQQLTESFRRELRVRDARLAPFEVLTNREKYVLSELMGGHNADTIARRSSVSISTVRSQIKAILQKLGVNSQLAAAGLARQAGWQLEEPVDGFQPHTPLAVQRDTAVSA
jgi:two-component system, NarL family, nitrate/nitrite response regulator NarL